VKRRCLLKISGGAAIALPWPAFAQKDLPLVAVLVPGTELQAHARLVAIGAGLKEAGLIEGRNYVFALRFADGVLPRLPGLVQELAALKPQVIVSVGVGPVVVKYAPDLPHVFTAIADDPIKLGLVASFARPGGNTTGNVMTAMGGEDSMTQKRIGLFRELVPNFKRLGFIGTTMSILSTTEFDALRRMGSRFGFEVVQDVIKGADDIERGIAATNADNVDALYVSGEPHMFTQITRVAPLVVGSGKPTVSTYPEWARAGLLMSYSSDLTDGFRLAGVYVARILGGEKPGDLPIEQASKFILAINTGTAKQLGINVPPTFLADEVIE